MSKSRFSVISLFSGALGLDLGLERAGFNVRVAVECNRFAAETIRANRPDIELIEEKIERVSTEEILKRAGLKLGETTVVTAGPSCQAFSTAGQRGSISDPRGAMFRQFLRVVREAKPRFFVLENVRGVLSAAVKHRPLRKRGPGHPALTPEEELGSGFARILKELKSVGYYVTFDLLNTADYGVPQTRERVVFIGSRFGEPIAMPVPTHARVASKNRAAWITLREGLKELHERKPVHPGLSKRETRYLQRIPAGGNWRSLPKKMHAKALGKAFKSWGGRSGFLRRLSWNKPAPALTTRPDSKATMLCHPSKVRPLSIREYIRLQQFPQGWKLAGGPPQQYIQLGNAVPTGLGYVIGKALRKTIRQDSRKKSLCGKICCASVELMERIGRRPRTILNPIRMRKVKGQEAAKAWLGTNNRKKVLKYVSTRPVVRRVRYAEPARSAALKRGKKK